MATRVLLIEDEPLLVSLYTMVLSQANYTVSSASDAASGEEKAISTKPHVILLDLLIPRSLTDTSHGANVHEPMGFEVLRLVKGNPSLRDIRVIVLSNLDSDEHVNTARQLGADDYLVKSNIDPHDLRRHVDGVLHRVK